MKRISLVIISAAVMMGAQAQYKKASFFQRGHKTYGLTTGMKFFTDGVKAAPNFNFTYGNDKGNNRIFHWWDLDYTLASKYSYTSSASPSGTATVSGKAGGFLAIAYNWGIYLMDNKNEENKVLPFLKLGVNTVIVGRKYLGETVTPANLSPNKFTSYSGGIGFDAGAGLLYKIDDKVGIFGNLGYRSVFTGDNGNNTYTVMTSHPYINAGIRLVMNAED